MARCSLPLYEHSVELDLPERWQVHYASLPEGPTLSPAEMRAALANPIGTPRLSELARGKGNVVIVVDDTTRPTPAWQFLPHVIEELHAGGVEDSSITIMGGIALHRPMGPPDFIRKVGREIYDRYPCVNPSPWLDTVHLGDTEAGVPVKMSAEYVQADLRITCGGIIPHPSAGFGGGAKLTMPGVCGQETIIAHHRDMDFHGKQGRGEVAGNEHRAEIESIAALCPPEFIANPVINSRLEVAGLYCGHYIQAHRKGVEHARRIYAVDVPANADLAILSGAPQDSEISQGMKALADGFGPIHSVKPDGAVLYAAGGPEGFGYHHLGDHMRRTERSDPTERPAHYQDREIIFYSPSVSDSEFQRRAPRGSTLCRDLEAAVEALAARSNGSEPIVNVFPLGAMTLYAPGSAAA